MTQDNGRELEGVRSIGTRAHRQVIPIDKTVNVPTRLGADGADTLQSHRDVKELPHQLGEVPEPVRASL